jgi:hypothetical protein
MNTQQLKEQLDGWQDHYSDPADKKNHDFFTTLISAIERLEAAERERDELREDVKSYSEHLHYHIDRQCKAEAELARRDAAAGEPVALRWRFIPMYSDVPFMDWTYIDNPKFFPDIRAMEGAEIQEVFSVAPPAVLPSEKVSLNNGVIGFDEGYNQCLSDALALGAQQQKVVELPEPVKWPEIPFKYFSEEQVFSMLDAAGVKWEVKK